jgi:hypothetical protein
VTRRREDKYRRVVGLASVPVFFAIFVARQRKYKVGESPTQVSDVANRLSIALLFSFSAVTRTWWWLASSTFATQGAALAVLRDAVDLEPLVAASR